MKTSRSEMWNLSRIAYSAYNIDDLQEIRRDRTFELFRKSRYNDIIMRWCVANVVLNEKVFELVTESADYEGDLGLYDLGSFQCGE